MTGIVSQSNVPSRMFSVVTIGAVLDDVSIFHQVDAQAICRKRLLIKGWLIAILWIAHDLV